jgi:hypothetical protein
MYMARSRGRKSQIAPESSKTRSKSLRSGWLPWKRLQAPDLGKCARDRVRLPWDSGLGAEMREARIPGGRAERFELVAARNSNTIRTNLASHVGGEG